MQTARRPTTRADYYRIVDVHMRLLARDASGTMALRLKLSMATGPSVHRHKWGSQQWPFLIEPVKCDLDSNLGVLFDRNWLIVGSVSHEKQAVMCGQTSRAFSHHHHNQ